ncbi:uncharacterized protein PV09_09692 [Verruconis gallopava]|uniref:Uncharacterized protein n=1 Tax=Verruconis gallopava TaxID=253628 RepID=A0A0D1ZWY8_9PEZI|nr:uncharacterized protein PV09_09692 [Verruconis gallopava]KIV98504.1 hypothetical protein PV09_09692 [Verruconis gallopava]
MESTMSTMQSGVQLRSPQDWIWWYSMIKATALDHEAWSYCNPDQIDELTPLEDPGQMTITQERTYLHRANDYKKKRKGLATVNTTIHNTVSQDYQSYLEDVFTPRERLTRLRAAIKPSTRQLEDSVREEYESLTRGTKHNMLDKWLNRWITLAPRLRTLNIPNLGEAQACRGFIYATETLNPVFYNAAMARLGEADIKADNYNQIKKVFELLRDNLPTSTNDGNSTLDTIYVTLTWHKDFEEQLKIIQEVHNPNHLTLTSLVGQFRAMLPSRLNNKKQT